MKKKMKKEQNNQEQFGGRRHKTGLKKHQKQMKEPN